MKMEIKKTKTAMDTETFNSLNAIINYLRHDEEKHWQEDGRPAKGHIFCDITRVASWLHKLTRQPSILANQIKNVVALRQAIGQGRHEFKLCLRGGIYSRKSISLCADGRFNVVNHIDDTEQKLTGRQLYTQSNIGKGMKSGALVVSLP